MEDVQNKQAGRGWYGNSKGHRKAGEKGGKKTAERGPEYFREIGRIGGLIRAKV